MRLSLRACVAVAAILLGVRGSPGQGVTDEEKPTRHVPVKAATRQELDRLEALKLYGEGLLHQRNNHLVEAVRSFEEALRLDPEAAPVHKALVPLYLALDRTEDALASCRRALELDSGDCETGYLYARQLRALERGKEARVVLERVASCPGLKDRPDLHAQVCFELGVMHEEAQEWASSERRLREVTEILEQPQFLQQGPYNKEEIEVQAAETYERLGQVCLRAGHADQAVAAFRQAQRKDPLRAPRLSYNLAEVCVGQGKWQEALDWLEKYLDTGPQGTEGYELKIKLQRQLGREAQVLTDLEAAARRDSNNTGLQLLLAKEYRQARRPGYAEQIYLRLLHSAPSAEVCRGLFDLYKEEGRRGGERCLARLDEALRSAAKSQVPGGVGDPAQARAMLLVMRGDPELVERMLAAARARLESGVGLGYRTRVLLASLAARTEQLEGAEAMYRSCLGQPAVREMEPEIYGGLLTVLARGHKHQAIIELCAEGLKTAEATNRVMFHLELARSHMALNHVREALAAADEAVKEAGEKERLLCRLTRAGLLSQAGRHAEAIAECKGLLREYNQPGDVREVRLALSSAYLAGGEPAQSEEQLQRVLKADPADAEACNDLGYQWADRNHNLAEAEQLIRKAMDLDHKQRTKGDWVGPDSDRDNAAYVDSLGWVLFRRGDLAGARRELERAVTLPGGIDDPVVWDHLADVYFRLEERTEAAGAWKKALRLYAEGARRADGREKGIEEKLRLVEP